MKNITLPDGYELDDFTPVIIPFFSVGCNYYFDTNDFTSLIKIQPTRTWRQKIPKLINKEGIPQVAWEYRFQYMHADWIEQGTDDILSLFHPLHGLIKQFIRQNKARSTVYLRIFISGREKTPLMQLTQKTMRRICELGSSFQIDVYPIDKIEPYEQLAPISCMVTEDGDAHWVLESTT